MNVRGVGPRREFDGRSVAEVHDGQVALAEAIQAIRLSVKLRLLILRDNARELNRWFVRLVHPVMSTWTSLTVIGCWVVVRYSSASTPLAPLLDVQVTRHTIDQLAVNVPVGSIWDECW